MDNFKIGSEVIIKGVVKYFQDHAMWQNDFADGKVFKIHAKAGEKTFWCEADGYGILGQGGNKYGNGKIAINEKYLHQVGLQVGAPKAVSNALSVGLQDGDGANPHE